MQRKMLRWLPAPALALALLLGACSDIGDRAADQLTGPQSAHLNKSGRNSLTKVRASLSTAGATVDEQELHASGGVLHAGSYWLVVPAGAINKPTVFRMAVRTDGVVGVTLTATQQVNGSYRDVGPKGFKKELILALSYEGTEEQVSDPTRLLVAWDRGDAGLTPVRSSVDTRLKVVYGFLKHFSDYALAFP